jgi:hypothetical protein
LEVSTDVSDFESLVHAIVDVHGRLHQQAAEAINTALTLRNWLIGCYVHEYELGGRDRADYYGERLIERLANRLSERGVPRADVRELRRYRLFVLTYPQIRNALTPDLVRVLPARQAGEEIRETVSPESPLTGPELLHGLSFSHLTECLAVDDPVKRTSPLKKGLRAGHGRGFPALTILRRTVRAVFALVVPACSGEPASSTGFALSGRCCCHSHEKVRV